MSDINAAFEPKAPAVNDDRTILAIFLGIMGLLFLYIAIRTPDDLMRVHALIFLTAMAIGGFALANYKLPSRVDNDSRYMLGIVKAGSLPPLSGEWLASWWGL